MSVRTENEERILRGNKSAMEHEIRFSAVKRSILHSQIIIHLSSSITQLNIPPKKRQTNPMDLQQHI